MSKQKRDTPHTAIKTLNIFDFDGTLFRSPSPNRKFWDDNLLSDFSKTTDLGGLGWWQDLSSLSSPCVPNDPGPEWFVDTILKKVKKSIKSNKSVTVLLSGRSDSFAERIKHILSDLKFDEFGFNTGTKITGFKCSYITSLIKKYSPKRVHLFDDNADQLEIIKSYLEEMHREVKVKDHPKEPEYTYLPYFHERDLISKLNKNLSKPLKWSESVLFTCVMLDNDSRNELMKKFPSNDDWTKYYEHLTICLGDRKSQKNQKIPLDPLGTRVNLTVQSFGGHEKAYAVAVTGYHSHNAVPHITCFVAPGCKPVDSNSITNWIPVPEFQISGTITEVKFAKKAQQVDSDKPAFPAAKFNKKKTKRDSVEIQQFFKRRKLRTEESSDSKEEVNSFDSKKIEKFEKEEFSKEKIQKVSEVRTFGFNKNSIHLVQKTEETTNEKKFGFGTSLPKKNEKKTDRSTESQQGKWNSSGSRDEGTEREKHNRTDRNSGSQSEGESSRKKKKKDRSGTSESEKHGKKKTKGKSGTSSGEGSTRKDRKTKK